MVNNIYTDTKMLIAFLRSGICDTKMDPSITTALTEDSLLDLFILAKKHDLAQIVAEVLFEKNLISDGEIADIYRTCLKRSVLRYQQMHYEFLKICRSFEENQIPYLPLKGSVIRRYYPEPWLRTSCDIDILVKKEDLQRASELLIEHLGYDSTIKEAHDWGFLSKNKTYIELHFDLIAQKSGFPRRWSAACLADVWCTATVVDGTQFQYAMPDELFYFYHIAHMAKHFENGGCGMRPFLDLWLLDNTVVYDKSKRDKLLQDGKLLDFANAVRKLSSVWLDGVEYDQLAKDIEDYITDAGVYGSVQNKVAFYQNKRGSKVKYVLSRLIAPYDDLKYQYPILEKYCWLLPLCEVRRWFRLLSWKNRKRSVAELKFNSTMSDAKMKNTANLIDRLGL
ncbi:MAG: nucleotidyltransferase family protein [Clostridia bacterium]|nr:nucleotidyltransferase family protein [Clostridia bacterium]